MDSGSSSYSHSPAPVDDKGRRHVVHLPDAELAAAAAAAAAAAPSESVVSCAGSGELAGSAAAAVAAAAAAAAGAPGGGPILGAAASRTEALLVLNACLHSLVDALSMLLVLPQHESAVAAMQAYPGSQRHAQCLRQHSSLPCAAAAGAQDAQQDAARTRTAAAAASVALLQRLAALLAQEAGVAQDQQQRHHRHHHQQQQHPAQEDAQDAQQGGREVEKEEGEGQQPVQQALALAEQRSLVLGATMQLQKVLGPLEVLLAKQPAAGPRGEPFSTRPAVQEWLSTRMGQPPGARVHAAVVRLAVCM